MPQALLLTPAIAMQVSREWNWGPGDFAGAAILIGGVGLGVEWAVRRTTNPAFRLAAAVALVGALLLAWINAPWLVSAFLFRRAAAG